MNLNMSTRIITRYVYTDGSQNVQGLGCAFVHGQLRHKTNLKKEYSIFTAEATASILQDISYIKVSAISKSVICTDSRVKNVQYRVRTILVLLIV